MADATRGAFRSRRHIPATGGKCHNIRLGPDWDQSDPAVFSLAARHSELLERTEIQLWQIEEGRGVTQ